MPLPRIFSGPRRRLFTRLIFIGFAQAGVTVLTALIIKFIFDQWITGGGAEFNQQMLIVATTLVFTTCIAALLRYRERVDAEHLGQSYSYAVRLALYDRLVTIAPRALQKRSRGGNLLRFIGDLTALRQWVSQGLAVLFVAITTTIVALISLTFLNFMLAAAVTLVMAIGAALAFASGGRMQERLRESRRRRAYIAANVNEKISFLPVVQVFDQSDRERKHLAKQGRRLLKAMVNRARIVGRLRGITEATNGLATGAVLFVGVVEVSQGRATPGMVVASMSVLGMLLPALRNLGRIYEYWHAYKVGMDKIRTFMETPTLITDTHNAQDLQVERGRIEFKNISVHSLFESLNATAEGGCVVAVVGGNGTGKSTLLNLLTRLLDPDAGQVLIDGQNIKQCTLSSLRRTIGVVSPDLPLLRGSIERNIRYRFKDAPDREVTRVMDLCGITKMLKELPEGGQTRIVDGGMNLSFGQRQRIAIARAMLGSPRILLLDEADANLDFASRTMLDHILDNYQGTVLIITHRFDRAEKADAIWHLGQGGIVVAGSPAELLNCNGPTSRLFNSGLKAVV